MSAQSHFFIESGGFPQQQKGQEFGPVSETVFNLTSKFTFAAPKKAFSICKGVVLVQPQTGNSNKVNLILRPYKQPFPGLNVKYFIYRGLQKSDFFNNDTEPLVINNNGQVSDLIDKINIDFEAFYNDENSSAQKPPFKASFIGYTQEPDLNTPLSDFFFKESQFKTVDNTTTETHLFELPLIDSGKTLGNFAQGECGIDVVLNYGDYKNDDNNEFAFNLEYACKSYAKIEVNGSTDFIKKLQREQSTQFVDIAAFYGLHAKDGSVTVDAAGTKSQKKGNAIYSDVLINFYNRNKVYLYIESNRHRSYNFYNNYKLSETSNIDIKTGTHDNLAETTYNNLSWPVVIIDNDQLTSNDYNDVSIQLVTSSDYEEIALYSIVGSINTESEREFIVKENLLDLDNNVLDSNFTKTISFKVPNINIAGQNKNISSLIRLVYIGKQLDFSLANNYTVWTDKKRHSLYNNIFPNLTIKPVFNNNQNFLTASFNRESLINYKGFSNYMKESVMNGIVVFQDGKKGNLNTERVLFIAKKIETLDDFSIHNTEVFAQGAYSKKRNIDSNLTDHSNYFSSLYGSKDYNLKHYIINESENEIKALSLNFKEELDFDFYNLGITKVELDLLKQIIPANSSNITFYLNDDLENPRISTSTNNSYFKYSLGILYENINGVPSTTMPQNPIYIYGISHKFLTTKEYADYEDKSILRQIINETTI